MIESEQWLHFPMLTKLVAGMTIAGTMRVLFSIAQGLVLQGDAVPTPDELLLPHYHIRPQYEYDADATDPERDLNWSNDPNGPVYFNGKYHYFMQYRTPRTWAHAISNDLVHWDHVDVAWSDDDKFINRSWTGSASIVEVDGVLQPVMMFTCVSEHNYQNICFATPDDVTDPLLKKWKLWRHNPAILMKDLEPALVVNTTCIDNCTWISTFRDPSSLWMLNGSSERSFTLVKDSATDNPGQLLRFSVDEDKEVVSKSWKLAEAPLFDWSFSEGTRQFRGPECASVFAVSHPNTGAPVFVLKASIQAFFNKTSSHPQETGTPSARQFRSDLYYLADEFSGTRFVPDAKYTPTMEMLPMDGSSFNNYYASKSFVAPAAHSPPRLTATSSLDLVKQANPGLRRIFWAWSADMEIKNTSLAHRPYWNLTWSGINTLPRDVLFDPKANVLTFNPVEEIVAAREDQPIVFVENLHATSEDSPPEVQVEHTGMALYMRAEIPTKHLQKSQKLTLQLMESEDKTQRTGFVIEATEEIDDSDSFQVTVSSDRSAMCGEGCGILVTQKTTFSVFKDELSVGLDIYVDMSIIEIFAQGGRSVLTVRTYPDVKHASPDSFGFSVYGAASLLKVYKMRTVVPRSVKYVSTTRSWWCWLCACLGFVSLHGCPTVSTVHRAAAYSLTAWRDS